MNIERERSSTLHRATAAHRRAHRQARVPLPQQEARRRPQCQWWGPPAHHPTQDNMRSTSDNPAHTLTKRTRPTTTTSATSSPTYDMYTSHGAQLIGLMALHSFTRRLKVHSLPTAACAGRSGRRLWCCVAAGGLGFLKAITAQLRLFHNIIGCGASGGGCRRIWECGRRGCCLPSRQWRAPPAASFLSCSARFLVALSCLAAFPPSSRPHARGGSLERGGMRGEDVGRGQRIDTSPGRRLLTSPTRTHRARAWTCPAA